MLQLKSNFTTKKNYLSYDYLKAQKLVIIKKIHDTYIAPATDFPKILNDDSKIVKYTIPGQGKFFSFFFQEFLQLKIGFVIIMNDKMFYHYMNDKEFLR